MTFLYRLRGRVDLAVGDVSRGIARRSQRVHLATGVQFVGRPRIRIHPQAALTLHEDVVINSAHTAYHSAMFKGVHLIASTPNAAIEVGASSRLNGCTVHAQARVTIGSRVLIAAHAVIIDSNGHPLVPAAARTTSRDRPKPVVIEDDTWIGLGAVVLPGTHIGAGSVIGANVVVSGRIPPNSVVRQSVQVERLRGGDV